MIKKVIKLQRLFIRIYVFYILLCCEDINLDVDKDTLKCTVEAYMRRHTELLEDYEQRWHKLKLSIEKW